jgi:hypothetical protein
MLALNHFGYFPERWLADQMVSAVTATEQEVQLIAWVLAAVVGIGLAAAYEIIANKTWRRPHAIAAPPTTLSPASAVVQEQAPEPDVWLQDAIWRAFNGNWDRTHMNMTDERANRPGADNDTVAILNDMRQHAFDGRLDIWGRQGQGAILRKLGREYWSTHQIELMSILDDDPAGVQTELAMIRQNLDRRDGLRTNRAQVERLWPLANTSALKRRGS